MKLAGHHRNAPRAQTLWTHDRLFPERFGVGNTLVIEIHGTVSTPAHSSPARGRCESLQGVIVRPARDRRTSHATPGRDASRQRAGHAGTHRDASGSSVVVSSPCGP